MFATTVASRWNVRFGVDGLVSPSGSQGHSKSNMFLDSMDPTQVSRPAHSHLSSFSVPMGS